MQGQRKFRVRELRWIVAGWCCTVTAWATAAWMGDGSTEFASDPVGLVSPSPPTAADPLLLKEFYAQLLSDSSMTGDEAVRRMPTWSGSIGQREYMRQDGERKLLEGESMTEVEWAEKASRFRLGAEAVAVAMSNVPRKLERAADACVASGDLLQMNGQEGDAMYRYVRAIALYDKILSQVGSGMGELPDRIRRKRSMLQLEIQRRGGSGDLPRNASGNSA